MKMVAKKKAKKNSKEKTSNASKRGRVLGRALVAFIKATKRETFEQRYSEAMTALRALCRFRDGARKPITPDALRRTLASAYTYAAAQESKGTKGTSDLEGIERRLLAVLQYEEPTNFLARMCTEEPDVTERNKHWAELGRAVQ